MLRFFSLPALAAGLALGAAGCAASTDERPAEFGYIVQAILAPSCGTATCHNSMTRRAGFALDTLEEARETFDNLRPFAPTDDPADSELLFVLRTDDPEQRMPLDSPMPDADIALIERWIIAGAVL
jgi:Planctomycete cytochrome C